MAQMFTVDDLQAAEIALLPRHTDDGVVVDIAPELDDYGFHRVAVSAPTRDLVLAFVREHWGDDDDGWFQEWVVGRVFEVQN